MNTPTRLLPDRMFYTLTVLVAALIGLVLITVVLVVRAVVMGEPMAFAWAVGCAVVALMLHVVSGRYADRCQQWLDEAEGEA